MKYLNKYRIFESIDKICKSYGIRNYTINPDGLIDVDGSVNLSNRGFNKIPVKFGKVTGNFFCNNNQLTTLEGCPKIVTGGFYCDRSQLTTLVGCPLSIGGSLWCYNNQLTSLIGLTDVSIGEDFYYENNPIYHITSNWLIDGERPDMDLIELFNDVEPIVGDKLYLSKLEYFHEEIGESLPTRYPNMVNAKKYYKIIE